MIERPPSSISNFRRLISSRSSPVSPSSTVLHWIRTHNPATVSINHELECDGGYCSATPVGRGGDQGVHSDSSRPREGPDTGFHRWSSGGEEEDTVGDGECEDEKQRVLEDGRSVQMQVEESPQPLQGWSNFCFGINFDVFWICDLGLFSIMYLSSELLWVWTVLA